MTRDPWADDWEDDWTKAAKETKSSSEIWSQANANINPNEVPAIAPTIAYRPQVKILKRETNKDAAPVIQKEVKVLDQGERELRYREARERLFGTPEPVLAAPIRRSSPAQAELIKPERQARGPPEGSGRGGFGSRSRGQAQKTR